MLYPRSTSRAPHFSPLPLFAVLALGAACASTTGRPDDTGVMDHGGQPSPPVAGSLADGALPTDTAFRTGGRARTGGSTDGDPAGGTGGRMTGGTSSGGRMTGGTSSGGRMTGGNVTGGSGAGTGGSIETGGTPSAASCPTSPTTQALIQDLALPRGPNYAVASFRLWYPKDTDQVKGVLVLLPGSNTDGRSAVNQSQWQSFATAEKLALLGVFFQDTDTSRTDEYYAQAGLGSGQALLDALTSLAAMTNRCELAKAPLLLWGFSAGGQFAYDFTCFAPERVLAFVVNKGGYYHPVPPTAEAMKVPALMFLGGQDLARRIDAINNLYALGRAAGAPWALTVERTRAHEQGDSITLALPYFHAILPRRIAPGAARPVVDQSQGYLGDLDTLAITPASATPPENLARTAWLPDQATASAWQAVVKK